MAHRTNPALWERIVKKIKSEELAGTQAGQWSARKAQMAVKQYKEKGGRYIGKKDQNNSLVKWTRQDWTTKSGSPSHLSGERYLPRKAIQHLSPKEYKETSKLKREGMRRGEQYVKQPKDIQEKTRKYRE
jgi:hypothetical protein